MSSRCRDPRAAGLIGALLLAAGAALAADVAADATADVAAEAPEPLRVCADPHNLPFASDDPAAPGLEPRIAEVLADELHRPLELHWQPQRRGLVRKALREGPCDVLIGVPEGLPGVATTRPYYRAPYAIVTRADAPAPLESLADPRLTTLHIGVPLAAGDLAATPPGHWLARRGALEHVAGMPLEGATPVAQRLVDAVARHELDAAFVWGAAAGWHAMRTGVPMRLVGIGEVDDGPPSTYAMAVGVRPGDTALKAALQQALDARRDDIDAILSEHHVLRSDAPPRAR